jgi:hypothetical protein
MASWRHSSPHVPPEQYENRQSFWFTFAPEPHSKVVIASSASPPRSPFRRLVLITSRVPELAAMKEAISGEEVAERRPFRRGERDNRPTN